MIISHLGSLLLNLIISEKFYRFGHRRTLLQKSYFSLSLCFLVFQLFQQLFYFLRVHMSDSAKESASRFAFAEFGSDLFRQTAGGFMKTVTLLRRTADPIGQFINRIARNLELIIIEQAVDGDVIDAGFFRQLSLRKAIFLQQRKKDFR